MTSKPFPSFQGLKYSTIYAVATSYRSELRSADNGAADKNPEKDWLHIQYDDVSITAKVPSSDGSYEMRHRSKDGVTVSRVDGYGGERLNITSVSKSAAGSYTGFKAEGCRSYHGAAPVTALTTEESVFLFNLHDPGLKSTETKSLERP